MADSRSRRARRLLLVLAAAALAALPRLARADDAAAETAQKSVKLFVYDGRGRLMSLPELLRFIGRADRGSAAPGENRPGLLVETPDETDGQKPELRQDGPWIALSWTGLPRVSIALAWPVSGDGFSTVRADKDGAGFADGDAVYLNEEIAFTEYRRFHDAWLAHTQTMRPAYRPSDKASRLAENAEALMLKTKAASSGAKRAALADEALRATARAWEEMLVAHGVQIAGADKSGRLRFGMTLDAGIRDRLPDYRGLAREMRKAGVGWVRLDFAQNPSDFDYALPSSFDEYDAAVAALNQEGIRVMGCVLDSARWPAGLTPALYAARTRNLVLHYERSIRSWEAGNEINGNWLGGIKAPASLDRAFRIYAAGAAAVKAIDPRLETVATLYWWEATAPDFDHSLGGWLLRYASAGFSRDTDVVALSLEPEDNPVGLAFEPAFERLSRFLPDKKVMVGDFEYGEMGALKGYWWLSPKDVGGAREDLTSLYTPAACAVANSLCGGFYWNTLERMFPSGSKPSSLFRVYQSALKEMGR